MGTFDSKLHPRICIALGCDRPKELRRGWYTSSVRQLIVNGDDFGLTAGVNRGIVEAHRDGVLTSATLMANGAALQEAVEAARAIPNLSVGCHVVLVDGAPVGPAGGLDTLVAIRSAEPEKFYSSLSSFAARATFGGFDRDQLVDEIVAQIRKIQAAGIEVTHLDSHKHTHVFPDILQAMLRAARICGVRAIRNPLVPVEAIPSRRFRGNRVLLKRYGQVRMLRTLGRNFRPQTARAGLKTPDGVVGVIETGRLDATLLKQALADLPEGTWELVCHPGYSDPDLRATGTRLVETRDQERDLLVSADLKQFLEQQKIGLASYRDFVANAS